MDGTREVRLEAAAARTAFPSLLSGPMGFPPLWDIAPNFFRPPALDRKFEAVPAWPPRSILLCDAGGGVASSARAAASPPLARLTSIPLDLITAEGILKHIAEIADDKYQGRDSPSTGLDLAARYIRGVAAANGLVGANPANAVDPFFQPFTIYGFSPLREFQASFRPRDDGRKPEIYGPKLFEYAIHQDEWKSRTSGRPAAAGYYEWGTVRNVVGVLEGSDPALKDEVVIVSAHYDHVGTRRIGTDRIYNGADDNASGAAVLMGLLPALAKMKTEGRGPKRSIVFVWTAAEEKGLVGADYYRRNPLRPLARTTAAINIDMIARLSAEQVSAIDVDRAGKPNFFRDLLPSAAAQAGFSRVDHNIDSYLDRQDGGVWVDAGIPTLFLFEGFTADGRLNPDYHGVDDELAGIVADNGGAKIERATKMTLLLLLAAGNR